MRSAAPVLVLFAIVALAPAAFAAPPILHGRPRPWQPPAATMAGMRVAIDPITGALVSPAPGDPALVPIARSIPAGGFTIRTRSDGSRSVYLGGAIRAYTVVHLGPAGELIEDCVQVQGEAIAAPAAVAPANARPPVKR